MNIASKDFNLLVLFTILYEERSLSRSSVRMNLSQPALSHKLKKLRQEFDDPLFVRSGHGLAPTPKADVMAQEVCTLVKSLEGFYVRSSEENIAGRTDTIRLYSTDFIEFMLLPDLIRRMQQKAPGVRIVTRNTTGEFPLKALENGDCDIAIAGFFDNLPNHFYRQALSSFEFAVLSDRQNPYWGAAQSLKNFIRCKHVVTTLNGDLKGVMDKALDKVGAQREVIAGASSFLTLPYVIRSTDLLLTCLAPIAAHICQVEPALAMHTPPVETPPVTIEQVWHPRTHEDPLRCLVRSEIKAILADYAITTTDL
ncbi:LysR family transcriptional regulator [Salinimonas chungwhensis]|uniref:LysR family transcriptional regulator n=1 Tax=Salinimonas chungwhensis TaxID=265425 RepID=UPI00035C91DC|nr:LysR family transcriptional regulator [Salinimonas chungwhensis]